MLHLQKTFPSESNFKKFFVFIYTHSKLEINVKRLVIHSYSFYFTSSISGADIKIERSKKPTFCLTQQTDSLFTQSTKQLIFLLNYLNNLELSNLSVNEKSAKNVFNSTNFTVSIIFLFCR